MQINDDVTLDAATVRRTGDGYLVAMANVARTGIQLYRGAEVGKPHLDTVRVYRPPEQVFADAALQSFPWRPVTVDHPREAVTSDNWKRVAVGHIGDVVHKTDTFVRVPLVLMDAEAIRAVESGKRQLSMGYTAELVWGDGVTPDGEKYDAMQTDIRANHLAVVTAARGGADLRIGDDDATHKEQTMDKVTLKTVVVDGVSVEMTDTAAQIVTRHTSSLEKQIGDAAAAHASAITAKDAEIAKLSAQVATDASAAKTALEAKDAEIATLKKQLEDARLTPDAIDQLVKDRAVAIGKARALVGDKLVVDGKSDAEIRRQVVDSRLGDTAKGWTDDQVRVAFDTLTAGVKLDQKPDGTAALAAALGDSRPTSDATAARDAAHDGMVKHLGDAWKPKAA